ncbi:hypothetical protein DdX_19436 [Ditylenchus destructor]|uniref:Uncharacterized protein n=1 Tax=Ditylenchus destructor TaxID=166010 RepID=A0AAD4QX51_9BILA|nr:hypothetical protein DdX_19436 [Ditylenchus destructor]
MGSFGFASEEITAVFEKVLNESNLSSGQMEKFKLYLLNSLGRFGGNETIQSTLAGDVQEYEHVLPDYTTYIYFCAAIPAAFFCYGSRYVKDKPLRHQLLVNIGLILMYNVILLTVHIKSDCIWSC